MKLRLTQLSDDLKQKKGEADSSHRREERLQRENHELKSKLASLDRETKDIREKRMTAEAAQSKLEEDLTVLMNAEKQITKTTRTLE